MSWQRKKYLKKSIPLKIRFYRFSLLVPVLNQVKKSRKNSFFIRLSGPDNPGLKSELLRPKIFKKTLFMHLRPRLNSLEKKLFA